LKSRPASKQPAGGPRAVPLRFSRRGKVATAGIAFVAMATLASLAGWSAARSATRPATRSASAASGPVAHIVDGSLLGTTVRGTDEFLGVPYAAPPVGALRWRPPAAVRPWAGTRDATRFGSECVQPSLTSATTLMGSENCLYLNVYLPARFEAARLPVMVWIPGGGFIEDAGSHYDPLALANREKVVVVTVNYRLGPFGFLALKSLDAESPDKSSGDYGLMDEQGALRWVHANIAHFGGNPSNVTIFGQSAGAALVCDDMASPTDTGLFSRAIAESGCGVPPLSHAVAISTSTTFANRTGCTNSATAAACLRKLPASKIFSATGGESLLDNLTLPWKPNTSGKVLPMSAASAFAAGKFARVPLLQGTDHDEGRLFIATHTFGTFTTQSQYEAALNYLYGSTGEKKVLAVYPVSAYPSPEQALAAVLTDDFYSCLNYQLNALTSTKVPTYTYELDDPNTPSPIAHPPFPLGAYHGSDVVYVLGSIPPSGVAPHFDAAQQALSNTVQDYWAQFARTGNPNSAAHPAWAEYRNSVGGVEELTPTGISHSTSFLTYHHCSLWSQVGSARNL
jgi:para-nitrobenzyl esterase